MLFRSVSIAYAESMETVAANLAEVRPQLAMSVPRLFEKLYARVVEGALGAGGLKAAIFRWARGTADRWTEAQLAGKDPNALVRMQYALAQRLVFSKVRKALGGRMRYFVSGGAPLAPAIAKFFYGDWHPQVFLTMHQMEEDGPRFFVPPNTDPIDPNYDPCVPVSTDVNCSDLRTRITVTGTDVYRLDRDGDGTACEWFPATQ